MRILFAYRSVVIVRTCAMWVLREITQLYNLAHHGSTIRSSVVERSNQHFHGRDFVSGWGLGIFFLISSFVHSFIMYIFMPVSHLTVECKNGKVFHSSNLNVINCFPSLVCV